MKHVFMNFYKYLAKRMKAVNNTTVFTGVSFRSDHCYSQMDYLSF